MMKVNNKKVVIHDFSGHPFQADLSKELSKNDFVVYHMFYDNKHGPKADFETLKTFDSINVVGISPIIQYSKKNLAIRFLADFIYGISVLKKLIEIKPNIILSGNTPIDANWSFIIFKFIYKCKIIYWAQDLYGPAIKSILGKKFGFIGFIIGTIYSFRELRQISKFDSIIVISKNFKTYLINRKIVNNICIIENWGSLKESSKLKRKNKNNHKKTKIIYTGTLGWKHYPNVIYELASSIDNQADIEVYSQGVGFDLLNQYQASKPLQNLKLYELLPYKNYFKKLSEANLLIATLEEDASLFSVPSKILNYMCAGKPIAFLANISNPASEIIIKNEIGIVVDPSKKVTFNEEVKKLINDNEKLLYYGANARKYAENNFDIGEITQKFIKQF